MALRFAARAEGLQVVVGSVWVHALHRGEDPQPADQPRLEDGGEGRPGAHDGGERGLPVVESLPQRAARPVVGDEHLGVRVAELLAEGGPEEAAQPRVERRPTRQDPPERRVVGEGARPRVGQLVPVLAGRLSHLDHDRHPPCVGADHATQPTRGPVR